MLRRPTHCLCLKKRLHYDLSLRIRPSENTSKVYSPLDFQVILVVWGGWWDLGEIRQVKRVDHLRREVHSLFLQLIWAPALTPQNTSKHTGKQWKIVFWTQKMSVSCFWHFLEEHLYKMLNNVETSLAATCLYTFFWNLDLNLDKQGGTLTIHFLNDRIPLAVLSRSLKSVGRYLSSELMFLCHLELTWAKLGKLEIEQIHNLKVHRRR